MTTLTTASATSSTTVSNVNVNAGISVSATTGSLPNLSDLNNIVSTGVADAASIIGNAFSGATNSLGVNSPAFLNLPQSTTKNGVLNQTNAPAWPSNWNGSFLTIGTPTIPGTARGALINTGIVATNSTLTHACDFKFVIPSININVVNPINALKKAISNGKSAAAAAIRMAMNVLNNTFRAAVKLLLSGFNLDVTGQYSVTFSVAKGTLANVNEIVNKILRYITDASTVYYLLKDLSQIIAWIKSLPGQLQGILKGCLANFTNALQSVGLQMQSVQDHVNTMTGTTLNTAQAASSNVVSSNTTAAIIRPIITQISYGNPPTQQHVININGAVTSAISNAPASLGTTLTNSSGP